MDSVNLLSVCGSSFLWVFILLAILAVLMKIITAIFPQKEKVTDPAVLAAISTTMASLYPGTKITKIELKS